jgi:hypothetical protein
VSPEWGLGRGSIRVHLGFAVEDLGGACVKLESEIRLLRRGVDRCTAAVQVEKKIGPRQRDARGLLPGMFAGLVVVLGLAIGLFVLAIGVAGR